jgi:hypothetical protein
VANESIGRAVLEITVDDKQFNFALDQVDKRSEQTSKHLKGMSENLSILVWKEFGKVAVEAVTKVTEGVIELGRRGAEVHDVSNSFGILSQRAGESADVMLGRLREGTKGTISDFDLMTMANKALGSGIVKNSTDMGTLAEGARTLGKAVGVSTADAFETLTRAIATGRTAGLKQLGLFVDQKVATEEYARALNKNVGDLTQFEKVQALAHATLGNVRDRLKLMPADARDFGEQIDFAKTSMVNFRDSLALAVAESPVLKAGMEAANESISAAFGSQKTTIVQALVSAIETLAIWGLKAADIFLYFGEFAVQQFNAVKVVFNGVLELLFAGIGKVASMFATAAEAASKLPAVLGGPDFKQTAAVLREQADGANALAYGFGETKNAAADSAGVVHAGFTKAHEVLGKVTAAMEAQRGKAVETAATLHGIVPDLAMDPVPPRAEENTRKIQEAFRSLNEKIATEGKVGIDLRLTQLQLAHEKEIEGYRRLKEVSAAELEGLVSKSEALFQRQTAAALQGPDLIRDRTIQLQQELALAQTTGVEQRQMQLDFARQHELDGLVVLKQNYMVQYTDLTALVNAKYDELKNKASQTHIEISASSTVARDQQMMNLTAIAEHAKAQYAAMLSSGKATDAQLEASHKAFKTAQENVDKAKAQGSIDRFQMIAAASASMLRSLFGKNKAAAIAATIIETAAAVVSTFKNSGGWPWGLIPAAAMAAAGAKQIAQIKSQDAGFATGTPNFDFANFGKATPTFLHRKEAVIPQGGGHQLAGEIATSMGGGGAMPAGEQMNAQLGQLVELMQNFPRTFVRAMKNAQAAEA